MIFGIFCTGSRAAFTILIIVSMLNILFYIINNRNIRMIGKIFVVFSLFILCWKFLLNIIPAFTIERLTAFDSYSDNIRLTLSE